MASKIKVDQLETADGSGTIALQNQLSGLASASMPTGSVLQVVENVYSTAVSSGTTSMVDTGLTATITPSSTSSKILVMVNQPLHISTDTTSSRDIAFNICRGSTEILAGTGEARNDSSSTQRYPAYNSLKKLDSPNTTSATTYKTQFKLNAQQSDIFAQQHGGSSTMILMEIAG